MMAVSPSTIRRGLLLLLMMLFIAGAVYSAPVGPRVISNSTDTYTPREAAMMNTTGGSVTTMVLNATTQNLRWKAYVGNVTGKLTLDNAYNMTIFDWDLGDIEGEVYATRSATTINWGNVNCSNASHILNEERLLNHTTNPDDNISTTFASTSHAAFYTGTRYINSDSCRSVHTYVNSTNQSTLFEEVMLYDGTAITGGNTIYATILEQDAGGFDESPYDFQMILPEVALPTFTGATAYYFYVELS